MRGHKYLGKRLWDEGFQRVVLDHGLETFWQDAAQARQNWIRMESAFVKHAASITHDIEELPRGRFMMQETS